MAVISGRANTCAILLITALAGLAASKVPDRMEASSDSSLMSVMLLEEPGLTDGFTPVPINP